MSLYIYPESWTWEQIATSQMNGNIVYDDDSINSAQKELFRTRITTYVTDKDEPILIRDIVKDAQRWAWTQHEKRLSTDYVKGIVNELAEEWDEARV